VRHSAALADLEANAASWEFIAAVRAVMAAHPEAPGVGRAARVEAEPIRFRQKPTQRFEPGPVSRARRETRAGTAVFEVEQVFFGPFGPHGALPLHVTDDALRESRAGRPWLSAFLDLFTHRMTAFFFRALEAARITASRDLGPDDPYPAWINSLFGAGPSEFRERDAFPDDLRRYSAGWLAGNRRSAAAVEGVVGIVSGGPVTVEEFVPEWLPMRPSEQARLGAGAATLGVDAALGERYYSVQSRLRIRTAPLALDGFDALLPGGARHRAVRDAVRSVMGLSWAWEMQLVLAADAVPPLHLDGTRRLGWDTWAPMAQRSRPADDVVVIGTLGAA
jgi:type VI secretion system protein ImpH